MTDRSNQPPVLHLNPADPLVVATRDLASAKRSGLGVTPVEPIGRGHKLAVQPIASGTPVRKFGQIIGMATRRDRARPAYPRAQCRVPRRAPLIMGSAPHRSNLPVLPEARGGDLPGYRQRADGTIATRNYIGVLTTVNCSAQVARMISDHFRMSGELKDLSERRRRCGAHPQERLRRRRGDRGQLHACAARWPAMRGIRILRPC